jgi:hypothetical protein
MQAMEQQQEEREARKAFLEDPTPETAERLALAVEERLEYRLGTGKTTRVAFIGRATGGTTKRPVK